MNADAVISQSSSAFSPRDSDQVSFNADRAVMALKAHNSSVPQVHPGASFGQIRAGSARLSSKMRARDIGGVACRREVAARLSRGFSHRAVAGNGGMALGSAAIVSGVAFGTLQGDIR